MLRFRALLVLGFVVFHSALPVAAQQPARHSVERLFYYVDTHESWTSFERNVDRISIVAPGKYSVDEDGIVWGEIDPRVIRLAKEHDVAVLPLIVNPGFNQEMLHRFLTNDAARQRAIRSMVELCRRNGFMGFQVDFENLSINDRDAFTRFYREAADALHRAGYKISAAVVHRPDELAGPTQYHKWLFKNWRAGYDLEAIGEIGDFISIMSYNQHTRRTPPGPQHGIPWMREVIEHFAQSVPREKLSLGIITGGQHWYTSQEDRITPEMARSYSAGLSHPRAMGMIEAHNATLRWDDEHQVSYTFFSNGGTFEWIFLEDARSFQARLGLVDEYGLRGFSVWVLGPEDPGIWELLGERRPTR